MILYGHPLSSYTWKALIPLYEKGLVFELRVLDEGHPEHEPQLKALWAPGKFPVLDDGGKPLIESTIIIEHLDLYHPGPRMIPADAGAALKVRFMDRVFDHHVMASMQAIVNEHLPFITATPDQGRVERAKGALKTLYGWLDQRLPSEGWACGDAFSLADCAAAPSLFYADWMLPITADHANLKAYLHRLLARPSVARTINEAEHCFHMVPVPRSKQGEDV
jgi:glutathione S-transferase